MSTSEQDLSLGTCFCRWCGRWWEERGGTGCCWPRHFLSGRRSDGSGSPPPQAWSSSSPPCGTAATEGNMRRERLVEHLLSGLQGRLAASDPPVTSLSLLWSCSSWDLRYESWNTGGCFWQRSQRDDWRWASLLDGSTEPSSWRYSLRTKFRATAQLLSKTQSPFHQTWSTEGSLNNVSPDHNWNPTAKGLHTFVNVNSFLVSSVYSLTQREMKQVKERWMLVEARWSYPTWLH